MGTLRQLAPRLLLPAGVVLALAASGCTAQASPSSTSSPPSSSTTTTSLAPVSVAGTRGRGPAASLGLAYRIAVMPVPDGRLSSLVPRPGDPAYRQVVPIGYRQLGSGPPLLLVAGEDASMSWWPPELLDDLAAHYRVTVFDLPGVGYSGAGEAAASVAYFADVVAGLVNELHLVGPTVVGWGMGGQVALALAERHRGLVDGLVLVNTGVPTGASRSMRSSAASLLADPDATLAQLSNLLFGASSSAARALWLSEVASEGSDVVISTTIRAEARAETEFFSDKAIRPGLERLRLPVLVVTGGDDAVFPVSDGAALAAAIPHAKLYLWPKTGYGDLVADPTEFTSIVTGFTS